MIKISTTLKEVFQQNPFLQFGFAYKLFNLTQLSRYLQPIIETKLNKEVATSAITMNLSRLQQQVQKITPQTQNFKVDKISVFSNLATASFLKSKTVHQQINQLYQKIITQGAFFSFSESMTEITVFFERDYLTQFRQQITTEIKYQNNNISAVSVKFSKELFHTPGILSLLMQRLTFQGINIVEIASTYTEIVFYVHDKDLQITFDSLYTGFVKQYQEKPF